MVEWGWRGTTGHLCQAGWKEGQEAQSVAIGWRQSPEEQVRCGFHWSHRLVHSMGSAGEIWPEPQRYGRSPLVNDRDMARAPNK